MKKPKKNERHLQRKKMKKEARRKKIRKAKRKVHLALIDKMRNMDEDELREFLGEDYEPEPEDYEEQIPGYDV